MKILMSFFIVFLFTACSGHHNQLFDKNIQQTKQYKVNKVYKKSVVKNYHITFHDRLSIVFYKYPELSTTTKESAKDDFGIEVGADGAINLPLVHTVKVVGLTKSELESVLRKKYTPYLQDPAVKVEILNKRVFVTGEVKNPGSLECIKYQNLTPMKAIIEKGGLTKYSNLHTVKVLRDIGSSYKLYNIDLSDMKSVRANNIVLQPNDIVYVPHNKATDFSLPINGVEPSLSIINTILNSVLMFKSISD